MGNTISAGENGGTTSVALTFGGIRWLKAVASGGGEDT